jgi:anti-anti-sigma factor
MFPVQTLHNNQRLLNLEGRFDAHRVDQFQDNLTTDQATFIDLSKVSFIDLSGIAALQSAQDRFRDANQEFCITGVSDTVRLILELTGVVTSMAIVFADDMADRVQSTSNTFKQVAKTSRPPLFTGKLLMKA